MSKVGKSGMNEEEKKIPHAQAHAHAHTQKQKKDRSEKKKKLQNNYGREKCIKLMANKKKLAKKPDENKIVPLYYRIKVKNEIKQARQSA